MNNCIFIGRLGHDVSLRYAQDRAVGTFSVALDNGKDEHGNKRNPTWINCVAFGRTAETIERFFKKGSRIGIITHARENVYRTNDNNGNEVEKRRIEFIIDKFDFVDDRQILDVTQAQETPIKGFKQTDEDIPF